MWCPCKDATFNQIYVNTRQTPFKILISSISHELHVQHRKSKRYYTKPLRRGRCALPQLPKLLLLSLLPTYRVLTTKLRVTFREQIANFISALHNRGVRYVKLKQRLICTSWPWRIRTVRLYNSVLSIIGGSEWGWCGWYTLVPASTHE